MSMKNPLTPFAIEPATYRFVAQHLNHWATAVSSQQIYLIIFLDFLSPPSFIPPQNAVYFLMLPFLVHKIFTFYINGVLNCKCPAPGPEGNVNGFRRAHCEANTRRGSFRAWVHGFGVKVCTSIFISSQFNIAGTDMICCEMNLTFR